MERKRASEPTFDVSVIIPAFNRADTLPRAIESALLQSHTPHEIIVVDDGSTDRTPDILRRYSNCIRVIQQSNQGVSVARNQGVLAAAGNWVAFLDSDDEWLPEKLMTQIEELRNEPLACLHTTNATLVRGEEKRDLFSVNGFSAEAPAQSRIDRPLDYQVRFGLARVQCSLIRRSALLHAGLFDALNTGSLFEDQDLACRVALEGPWIISNRELVIIYQDPPAAARASDTILRNATQSARAFVGIYGRIMQDRRLTEWERILLRKRISSYRGMLGMSLLREGSVRDARACLYQGLSEEHSLRLLLRYAFSYLPEGIRTPLLRRHGPERKRA